MADETTPNVEETAQEAAEPATNWQEKYEAMKAHSREWEKKAKANQGAADELEKLRAANMTEQEKANARAEKAEAELAQLKAQAERVESARQLSESEGVPMNLLMYCNDAEAMKAFAAEFKTAQPDIHAAATFGGSAVTRTDGKQSTRDKFAAYFE